MCELAYLKEQVRELQIARRWLKEYRLTIPLSSNFHLSNYFYFLSKQEVNVHERIREIQEKLINSRE